MITCEIADTGLGISEEDQKALFKMFGKLRSTQQINTGGIGLGLFICKRICESFDGGIALTWSKVKEGTAFTFTMKTQGEPSVCF
jgi:signal transduction histidine kinase